MSNVLDKLKKLRDSRPSGQNFSKQRDIFYVFKDGKNIMRLVGEFVQVKTHFLAMNPKTKDRGLCIPDAFKGDNRISKMINCLDWDIEKEEATPQQTCPICKLARESKKMLKETGNNLSPEDKLFLEKLHRSASPTTSLKWNIIDRAGPEITEVDESGNEKKVKGYKVASIGMEAWKDIDGIFKQTDLDISDPDNGIDINIIKDRNALRVTYSAQPVMEGLTIKKTPLTPEEKEMKFHDLKRIAGKVPERQSIVDALHDDFREFIDEDHSGVKEESKDNVEEKEQEIEKEKIEPEKEEKQHKVPSIPVDDLDFEKQEKTDVEEKVKEEVKEEEEAEWECFGTYDQTNSECSNCSTKNECIEKVKSKKVKRQAK